jgi:predicted component of type VI protein secretion system
MLLCSLLCKIIALSSAFRKRREVLTPLLAVLRQVLVAVLEHTPDSIDLVTMQEELVSAAGSQLSLFAVLGSTWTVASCLCSLHM